MSEFISENYPRKLSPSISNDAEELRFIGILAYPKITKPFHKIR